MIIGGKIGFETLTYDAVLNMLAERLNFVHFLVTICFTTLSILPPIANVRSMTIEEQFEFETAIRIVVSNN